MSNYLIKTFSVIILLTLFQSCSKKELSASECEDISIKCYKGFPNSCNTLDNSCSKYQIKYTKSACQEAFNSLMLGASKENLEGKFGERITECFSDKEKDKYLKK